MGHLLWWHAGGWRNVLCGGCQRQRVLGLLFEIHFWYCGKRASGHARWRAGCLPCEVQCIGVRQWATYYGGVTFEFGACCAVDGNGNAYLAGSSNSSAGIGSGGHQNSYNGNYDAFLVKFDASGVRQWGTYYGGTNGENGNACAVDGSGNVYLAGQTNSSGSIASSGHQSTFGAAPVMASW